MTSREQGFIKANRQSPVVHFSVDDRECFYKLADGKIFRLTLREGANVGRPWLAVEELAA